MTAVQPKTATEPEIESTAEPLATHDEMVKEALTAMKADNYNEFLKTTFDQVEEREELWRKAQTIEKFEVYLQSVMTDGKIAKLTLDKHK